MKPLKVSKLLLGLGLGVMLTIAARAESTLQRDAPTTRFYTRDGKSAGTASTYDNTTKFYAPDGRLTITPERLS